MQEYVKNLKVVEEKIILNSDMIGFKFEVPKGRMEFLGLKTSRKNSLAVVYNSDLKILQTFSQEAIRFHYRRVTGDTLKNVRIFCNLYR